MKNAAQIPDLQHYSEDQIPALIDSLSPKELQDSASMLSTHQVQLVIRALTDHSKAHWSAKLHGFLRGINDLHHLESVGKAINLPQLLELLDFAAGNREQAWKLFPIFVTIPHPLFSQMLLEMPEKRKHQLQLLCASEPLQHHLLMYIHELRNRLEEIQNEFKILENDISLLNAAELSLEDLTHIQGRLNDHRQSVVVIRSKIENALSLAWNASSSDLIEMLSEYRERYERFLFRMIGHPPHHTTNSSGLFRQLEDQLASVFGKETDGKNLEALRDNEPALEALARLQLWYIEDYWKVGLLPDVTDQAELALPVISNNPALLAHYRSKVEHNLRLLGLKTVRDLKKHLVVSKALLANHIAKHQHKMK